MNEPNEHPNPIARLTFEIPCIEHADPGTQLALMLMECIRIARQSTASDKDVMDALRFVSSRQSPPESIKAKGGKARAAKLPPEERSRIASEAAITRWHPET